MQIPQDIVSQWSKFVTYWCMGTEPAEPPADVDRAFRTLRRLWPEYLNDMEARDNRSIFMVARAVSLGLTLAACEQLSGFEGVLARIRRGEHSAQAELEFAAALVRSGLTSELEPEYESKRLDCSVQINSERVFAEVIAPETSDVIKDAYAAMQRLGATVTEQTPETDTEILLEADPGDQFDAILASVAATPLDGTVHYVEGVGWISRVPSVSHPPGQQQRITDKAPGQYLFSVTRNFEAIPTRATVHLPISDERAHRLFAAEYDHFSQAERNILVVRTTNVPGGMNEWLSLARRWFQPTRNRRVGAIILYDQAIGGRPPARRQHWRVVENPHAYITVPDSLIKSIRALDESRTWGEDPEADKS
jgi:hypothetical protein